MKFERRINFALPIIAFQSKEIQIILRLFLVIAMYCQLVQASSINHSTSQVASYLGWKPRYMQQVAIHQKQPIYYLNFHTQNASERSTNFTWCEETKTTVPQEKLLPTYLGTIHILRMHIFRIFGHPSSLRKHVFSIENKQKFVFSDPPLLPLQVLA